MAANNSTSRRDRERATREIVAEMEREARLAARRIFNTLGPRYAEANPNGSSKVLVERFDRAWRAAIGG